MDTLAKIMGIAVVGAILAIFLKEKTPQFAIAVSLLTGILIFSLIAARLQLAVNQIQTMVSHAGIEGDTLPLILKILGVGMVSEYFCNLISDAGEGAIAKKAELSAKVIIFLMILPLIGKVVDTVWSMF